MQNLILHEMDAVFFAVKTIVDCHSHFMAVFVTAALTVNMSGFIGVLVHGLIDTLQCHVIRIADTTGIRAVCISAEKILQFQIFELFI